MHVLTFEFDELNHFSDCLDLFFHPEDMQSLPNKKNKLEIRNT